MKALLPILLIITLSNFTIAQTTAIPDANFEQTLINLGLDIAVDGQVLTTNIDTVTYLDVGYSNIIDLTGIEDFTSLVWLDCEVNDITSLDMSQNLVLKHLEANSNQLTSLNITQNVDLELLDFAENQITSIDISHLIGLKKLWCNDNLLTCLNVKNGNNTNILSGWFWADNNPNLTCIDVDDVSWATANWIFIDPASSFSTNCPNPCPVGIEEQNPTNLSIYPNPTSEKINIDIKLTEIIQINIVDITGKTIKTITHNTNTVNVAELPSGIYFLKVTTDEGLITKKFVKQ